MSSGEMIIEKEGSTREFFLYLFNCLIWRGLGWFLVFSLEFGEF